MTVGRWPDETRTAALQLLRDGVGTNETSRRTGVPAPTLSRWAKDAGIVIDRAAQTVAAAESTRLKWAQRREEIPDEVGTVLAEILEKCREATSGRDAHGYAMAYGTLIDKAQLLTGGPTSRHEHLDAQRRRDRVAELRDEVAERRALKDGTTGG